MAAGEGEKRVQDDEDAFGSDVELIANKRAKGNKGGNAKNANREMMMLRLRLAARPSRGVRAR